MSRRRPLPPLRNRIPIGWRPVYPWAKLQVGDWFEPVESCGKGTLYVAVYFAQKRLPGKKFGVKTTRAMRLIWRKK